MCVDDMKRGLQISTIALLLFVAGGERGGAANLEYQPAPVDNPLKGFVAFPGATGDFPHTLEYTNLPLRALMTGPTNFNWSRLDGLLNRAASRGNQFIFRIYLDYPFSNVPSGIPQYLIDEGLVVHPYPGAWSGNRDRIPDYEDPRLRAALTNYIAELGARYDGDPRIAFIEAGLLGSWGEWRTFSAASKLFASDKVQREVLAAYAAAFKKTKVLLRFPDAVNAKQPFGYHDDWFAWTTLGPSSYSFVVRSERAGPEALNKWRTHPIGGRLHPYVSKCAWDDASCVPPEQDFMRSLETVRLSWLRDGGMVFQPEFSGAARERALAAARRMGYELHIAQAEIATGSGQSPRVKLRIENRGVAPFYYDWPVELGAIDANGKLVSMWRTDWALSSVQPDQPLQWESEVSREKLSPGGYKLLLRVVHPLPKGKPLRFANAEQDRDLSHWLTLGEFTIAPGN
jgi:hypothetical protein